MTVDEAETKLIRLTLEHTRNNKTRAAEVLGISLKTLHNKLNRLRALGQPIDARQGLPDPSTGPPDAAASLRTKQVAGVTLIVGLAVTRPASCTWRRIARFSLEESAVRGELLARTIFQQASVSPARPTCARRSRPTPGSAPPSRRRSPTRPT